VYFVVILVEEAASKIAARRIHSVCGIQEGIVMRESISGKLITVRAYQEEHIEKLYAAAAESIPELSRYETWCRTGFSIEDATKYVRWCIEGRLQKKAYYFAVEHLATGEFLGSCGLSDILEEHRRAAMGFWVRSSQTRRGYATEAARIIGRLAFDDLGLDRIDLETAVDNIASRRVIEKLGCIFEGILHRRLVLPGGPTDTAMYCWLR
jgi:RimJ/RimL family protein N-acetyltransferase